MKKTVSKARSFRYLRTALRTQLGWAKAYQALDLDKFDDQIWDPMIATCRIAALAVRQDLKPLRRR